MKSGLIIIIVLLIPNVIRIVTTEKTADNVTNPVQGKLGILENFGRLVTFAIPVFYSINLESEYFVLALLVMIITLSIYYICWVRFFIHDRAVKYFSKPFYFIPYPMALMPVIFLVASSYIIGSWLLLVATLFFGIVHIWVSVVSITQ